MNLARPTQLLQFLGSGAEGDALAHLLATRAQVDTKYSIRSRSDCRTCLTLLDESINIATEIIEPSGIITEDEVNDMYAVVSDSYLQPSVVDSAVQGLAIMGSMPPGCPGDLYANLISLTCDDSSKVPYSDMVLLMMMMMMMMIPNL